MALQPEHIAELLKPALAAPAGSKERGLAVKTIAATAGVTPKAVRHWLRRVERAGLAGLVRRKRSDAGTRLAIVSTAYDAAIGTLIEPSMLESIAAEVADRCKQAYNSPLRSGRQVQLAIQAWLFHRTKQLGLSLSDAQLKRACRVPLSAVRRFRHFRVAHIRRADAPTYMAKYQPRGQRTREGLWYGAVVCIDCTALDIVLHDENGDDRFAKVIGFQDLATNTMFFYLVLPERGQGLTQAHVAAAFIEWVRRHGVPASLLVDNGTEFRKLDMLSDMMKLSARIGFERFSVFASDSKPELAKIVEEGLLSARSAVRRARPYNPQAKPIEGQFGNLTRFILSPIEGWIGGDRLNQPTKRQGHRAQHFTGTPLQLQAQIEEALSFYDVLPQSGHLHGRSPAEERDAQIAAGVPRVDVNIAELIEHWSTEHVCRVRQGAIKLPKLGRYWSPALGTLLQPARVMVRVPLAGDRTRLAVFDDTNAPLGFVEPVPTYHFLDKHGATSQRERAAAQHAAISAMDSESAGFDWIEARRLHVAAHAVPSRAQQSAGVIQVDKTAKLTAEMRRALPAPDAAPARSSLDVWLDDDQSISVVKRGQK